MVSTATTGRQMSWITCPQLWNSVFGTGLLEGLSGKAAALQNSQITVSRLEAYLVKRVPQLFTQNFASTQYVKKVGATTQTPMVIRPIAVPDFVILVQAPAATVGKSASNIGTVLAS